MIDLKSKIQNHNAFVGVIGLGYVGLPLALRFSKEGFKTFGLDIDKDKVKVLNAGKSYIKHINADEIKSVIKHNLKPTIDFSIISSLDVIIICVPTPLGAHNEPNLSYIRGTLESIQPNLKENQLLVLESTTYPGTTEEEIIPIIKKSGFNIGTNFFIGYSP